MSKIKFLALGVNKQVGKDTFCQLLREIKPDFQRVALADRLKEKCEGICYSLFGKQIKDLNPEEKELFRPILIEVGRVARGINKDYWCDQLNDYHGFGFIPGVDDYYILTDLRYLNEFHYFKNIYGDSMLFVNIERDGAPPPTDEEKIHGPEVAKMADVTLKWHTDSTLASLRPIVQNFYNTYLF